MSEGCSKTNRPRAVICRWNGLSENKTFTATCCESLAFRKTVAMKDGVAIITSIYLVIVCQWIKAFHAGGETWRSG
jgi:hypothetical protein